MQTSLTKQIAQNRTNQSEPAFFHYNTTYAVSRSRVAWQPPRTHGCLYFDGINRTSTCISFHFSQIGNPYVGYSLFSNRRSLRNARSFTRASSSGTMTPLF